MRPDGRALDELRKITITRNFLKTAEGSALIECGETKVICAASIEERVPPFLKDQNRGWITAEYAMLPRSTHTRSMRESVTGRIGGRTHEIQRLIGRVLRCVVDLEALGERTIWIDCDVLQADGGTRTAAITGAFVALKDAVQYAVDSRIIMSQPINDFAGAVSVGVVDGLQMIDLSFEEDSRAEVDMNIVMTGSGQFLEIQGTAERSPLDEDSLLKMLEMAKKGIREIVSLQKTALEE